MKKTTCVILVIFLIFGLISDVAIASSISNDASKTYTLNYNMSDVVEVAEGINAIINGTEYYSYRGKGKIIYDDKKEEYYFTFPSLKGSVVTYYSNVMTADSISKFNLRTGDFVDIKCHFVSANNKKGSFFGGLFKGKSDGKTRMVIDELYQRDTKDSTLSIIDMYENSDDLKNLKSKSDYKDFLRSAEVGVMCRMSVIVDSTGNDGLLCHLSGSDMLSSKMIIQDGSNSFISKYHVTILDEDEIEILCTYESLDNGYAYFNMDELLLLNGKTIKKFKNSKEKSIANNATVKTSGVKESTSSTANKAVNKSAVENNKADQTYTIEGESLEEYYTSDADRMGATSSYVVVNSPSDGYANIRYAPDIDSDIKYQWENGVILDYLGETVDTSDGRHWHYVGFYYWDDYDGYGMPRYMDGYISSKVCNVY